MASGSVSVRLPEEVLARLNARAHIENKKVSDVVRELIESGLRSSGSADNSGVIERIDKLEATMRALLGTEDATVVSRIDAVNGDLWQANEVLLSFLKSAITVAGEGKYYSRLAAMYGMDVAHYVAQKTEVGVVPKAPDKDERNKQLALHEKNCKEFASGVSGTIAEKEPS